MVKLASRLALMVALGLSGVPREVAAQSTEAPPVTEPPETCIDCHGQTDEASRIPPPHELLAASEHSTLDCESCHESVDMDDLDLTAEDPHGGTVEPVNCGECHDEEAEVYLKHGRLEVGKDPDLPQCWSCHGSHDIRS